VPDYADEVFLAIRWSLQDVLVALAMRLPDFEDKDTFDLLDEHLTPEVVGVSPDELRELAGGMTAVLEDISVQRGWDVIEESLCWQLGYPSQRAEKGQHPNSPLSK
jgi:hypothetical protein